MLITWIKSLRCLIFPCVFDCRFFHVYLQTWVKACRYCNNWK